MSTPARSERDPAARPIEALPAVGNCFDAGCPAREILAHVTGRWGGLVMAALTAGGTLRFSELRIRIAGISEKMLAQTLRELVRDGLVTRSSRPVVPPYVDYKLTPGGREAAAHLARLIEWINAHARAVVQAQRKHDAPR